MFRTQVRRNDIGTGFKHISEYDALGSNDDIRLNINLKNLTAQRGIAIEEEKTKEVINEN